MDYLEVVILMVVIAIGEAFIIYSMYKKILELERRIDRAVKELKPEKPKKKEEPKKVNFWRIFE